MTRIVSKKELANLKLPDLNNRWMCHYFLVHSESNRPQIFAQVSTGSIATNQVQFQEETDKVIVAVANEFIEGVAMEIYRRYHNS